MAKASLTSQPYFLWEERAGKKQRKVIISLTGRATIGCDLRIQVLVVLMLILWSHDEVSLVP